MPGVDNLTAAASTAEDNLTGTASTAADQLGLVSNDNSYGAYDFANNMMNIDITKTIDNYDFDE